MKTFLASAVAFLSVVPSFCGSAIAGTVYSTGVTTVHTPGSVVTTVEAWAEPNLGGDGAFIDLTVANDFSVTPTALTVGIGHEWFEVSLGTPVSPELVATATPFANVFTHYLGGPIHSTAPPTDSGSASGWT